MPIGRNTMERKPIAVSIAALVALLVVWSTARVLEAAPRDSGVTGNVLIYSCVVVIDPGDQCYKPYPTSIMVVTRAGNFVTKFMTDPNGRFEVFLKPGRYVLIPSGANSRTLLSVEAMEVRVEKGQFTPVQIVYDSGIR